MNHDVIIACDFPSAQTTYAFLDRFADRKPFVKIGMELFYAEGPQIVREIKARGHRIFLDLKLHDIPNTVGKAMRVLASLGVDLVNVHAAGGSDMMRAALDGLSSAGSAQPMLIAVTQLTSIDRARMNDELRIPGALEDTVRAYAGLAKEAGLAGVVCSPLETQLVKASCGQDFLTVTPGIRFSDDETADQARVTTPAKAKQLGSDFIVVGRSITASGDPEAAYARCLRDFCE